jgi:hypothetical protein
MAQGQQIISVPLSGAPQILNVLFSSSLLGVETPAAGDQLAILNEVSGEYRSCVLDAKGQWRWQDSGDAAGALVIEPGRGYLYNHTGSGFAWHWR